MCSHAHWPLQESGKGWEERVDKEAQPGMEDKWDVQGGMVTRWIHTEMNHNITELGLREQMGSPHGKW